MEHPSPAFSHRLPLLWRPGRRALPLLVSLVFAAFHRDVSSQFLSFCLFVFHCFTSQSHSNPSHSPSDGGPSLCEPHLPAHRMVSILNVTFFQTPRASSVSQQPLNSVQKGISRKASGALLWGRTIPDSGVKPPFFKLPFQTSWTHFFSS